MKLLRRIIKLTLLITHLFIGLLIVYSLFSRWLRPKMSPHFLDNVMVYWSYLLCRILNLRLQQYGKRNQTPTLFVANHITWLDIFALLGTFPVTFLAKQEVKHWPLLGSLVHGVGTLFIQRGNHGFGLAGQQMTEKLQQGKHVLFFPEGTSTDGTTVRRFFARLFQVSMDAQVPIQPIALRYIKSGEINTLVPFIGEESITQNIWRILGEKDIELQIWFCDPISPQDKQRRDLANESHLRISEKINVEVQP